MEHLLEGAAFRSRRIATLGRSVRPWDDLITWASLVRLLFRERPAIVHTHTAKAGTLGRLAAAVYNVGRRRSRRAVVLHTFHGHVLTGYFGPGASLIVRYIERTLSRLTDAIVTISPRLAQELVQTFGVATDAQTVVVPLGLELDALFEVVEVDVDARRTFGWNRDHVVVAFVGRFVPIKDLPTLVRAFAVARARVPQLRLLLVGDGEARPDVERLVAEHGLGDAVHLAGWRSDLSIVYAASDIVALSSRNEGTPVAAIEGMAAGRPVLATRVGGVPDVVQDGRTGVLCEAADVDGLALALERLAADPRWRLELGREGRAFVRTGYSHTRLVDDIDALYEKLLSLRSK
jgi:glycosyltransferase involved in cell wall biosynthesis